MQHFSELGDIQTNYIVQPGDSLVAIALKYRLCDEVGTQKGRARCLIAASRIASENAIANRKRQWEAIFEDARQQRLGQLNTMGLSRTDFARQLELDPAQLASTELSLLAGIGSQDAALRYSAEATNAANVRSISGNDIRIRRWGTGEVGGAGATFRLSFGGMVLSDPLIHGQTPGVGPTRTSSSVASHA